MSWEPQNCPNLPQNGGVCVPCPHLMGLGCIGSPKTAPKWGGGPVCSSDGVGMSWEPKTAPICPKIGVCGSHIHV